MSTKPLRGSRQLPGTMPSPASAAYRLTAAQNLLKRYAVDLTGQPTNVLEVAP